MPYTIDYYPEVSQFITILRNPFDVHLSTYFYVKKKAKVRSTGAYRNGRPHKIIANNWSLEDYLMENKKSYFCNFLPSHINMDNYKDVIDKEFIFVGISENLQESINVLAKTLGLPVVEVPKINVSEWTESVPKEAITDFISNNMLEMSIYHYVKKKLGIHHISGVT